MPQQPISVHLCSNIALWAVVGHALKTYNYLLQNFIHAQNALTATPQQWQQLGLKDIQCQRLTQYQQGHADFAFIHQLISDYEQGIYWCINLEHACYPALLKQISDAPPLLFGLGNMHALQKPFVAIVGTRHPSPTGRPVTEQFAKHLVKQGFYIASGLAHGVDKHAHIGAFDGENTTSCAKTVAVLGTGVNVCYPSQNKGLYNAIIAQGGAVISEFIPNSPAKQFHFPRRNRIVSGMALGTLITEASLDSGSLITAKLAAEQGRAVFAIPGHIQNPQAAGCHLIIREGAILVDKPEQIVEELNLPTQWFNKAQSEDVTESEVVAEKSLTPVTQPKPQAQNAQMPQNVPAHLQTLFACLDWKGQDIDQILAQSQTPIHILLGQLAELELLGFVVEQGGRYQRCLTQ